MQKKCFFLVFLGFVHLTFSAQQDKDVLDKKLSRKTKIKKKEAKKVWFRFKDEVLTNVVNYLATEKGLNIMLPQGPDALKTTLTFELPHKISLDEAWNHLLTILNLAGYTLIASEDFCTIVKNNNNVNKENLPLYVNVATNDLPDSSLRIRYIRYLTNIQVPGSTSSSSYSMSGTSGGGSLQGIIKDMLSKDSASDPAALLFDSTLNAIIISDRSNVIRGIMTIVDLLEYSTTGQTLKIIKLKHASATQLKNLFDELITGSSTSNSSAGYGASPTQAPLIGGGYFEKSTKIVAEPRTNCLLLLGKSDALERIESFIKTDLDLSLESGSSVLHVYTLQHLEAQSFANILTSIVTSSSGGNSSFGSGSYGSGTQQSTSTSDNAGEQYFKGVIIAAESSEGALQTSSYGVTSSYDSNFSGTSGGGTPTQGAQTGNRLIIAATRNDWIRLEKLIRELDQPQRQVAIQGLVVDMSEVGQRQLGTQLCSREKFMLKNVQGQSAQITSVPTTNPIPPVGGGAPVPPTLTTSLANIDMGNLFSKGSTAITISDPTTNDIWWITQIISNQSDSKILSQPFLFGTHNQTITFIDKEGRYIAGNATVQQGAQVQNKDQVFAELNLTIVPRISENGMINLGITLNINQWTDDSSDTQTTRLIVTNANIQSGDILVLGGLNKTKVEYTVRKTPLLGDIPLIGNLFKNKDKSVTKSSLMVFLRPEIVKAHEGIDYFTAERFNDAVDSLFSGENFEALRDPISRWFFGDAPRKTSGKEYEKYKNVVDPILSSQNLQYKPQLESKEFLPVPKNITPQESSTLDKDAFEEEIEKRINQSSEEKDIFEKDTESDIVKNSVNAKPDSEEEIAAKELQGLFRDHPLDPSMQKPSPELSATNAINTFNQDVAKNFDSTAEKDIIDAAIEGKPLSEEEVAAQELRELFKNNLFPKEAE